MTDQGVGKCNMEECDSMCLMCVCVEGGTHTLAVECERGFQGHSSVAAWGMDK